MRPDASAIVKSDTLLFSAFDRSIFEASEIHWAMGTEQLAGKTIFIVSYLSDNPSLPSDCCFDGR
jgi:hypothetical protein